MKKSLIVGVLCVSAVIIGCGTTNNIEQREKSKETIDTQPTTTETQNQTLDMPENKAGAERIMHLIQQIGSDDFETRDKAQKALEDIGEPTEAALKEVSQSTDLEAKNRAGFILKVITVKKRVKFSDMLLKEFPDIYRVLAYQKTDDKFTILQQITLRNEKAEFKYRDKITYQDITNLIGEILLEDGKDLDSAQKLIILVVASGKRDGYDHNAIVSWCHSIPESAQHLIKLLKDEDANIRSRAIYTLGSLGAKKAIPEIIKLLKDGVANVRTNSISVLVKLEAQEAIPEIIKLLREEEWSVRTDAIIALGNLRAKEAIPELIKLLKDEDAYVRGKAILAFGKLGAKEVIPEITKLLNDKDANVRASAISTIIDLGAKEAIPEIIKLLNDGVTHVRIWAIDAIGDLGAKEAIPEITKLLNDKDVGIRLCAIDSLVSLGAKEAIPEIIKVLNDKDKYVRSRAIYALGKLGDGSTELVEVKEAILDLTKLLKDGSHIVRGWVGIALVELGAKDKVPEEVIGDIEKLKSSRGLNAVLTDKDKKRIQAALKELGVTEKNN